MKKFFLVIAFLSMVLHAQAQLFSKERLANLETFDNRFLSWGYFLGLNQYDFKLEYENQNTDFDTDILVDAQMGFNVGLIGDLRINRYMNLRLEPGIYFTQRNLIFPGFEEDKDKIREVKSTYIHVPLLLKLSTKRINNFKPFIVMGISRSINLASNEKNPEDNFEGKFRMTRGTGYYELGFGIDLYLYYFKFSPSIRGVFASSNELVPDDDPNSPWTSNISALQTRGIFLNFTFQ
ncbi:MAG TPA: porin family protein [Flavobacteriaceae bacterium]|nr:PorT family protein [Flavobacteriaceae bacterium]MCB9213113.1 PorT family protein [Alteromonas sp.]HPF11019.1 porin family protein [Flavobacteriaceae bacterium]HQU21882.1 porin family protein [Flavobacteriaceae bacterium]HQU64132.1 porin family protein [Flavobacteriaceae bacterium]